ncbi:MAG: hypothetical protein NTX75_02870 [Proteobacteria bacterium]|nr:hypothetical protein [Pseudomonadota bacterium]
MLAFRKLQTPSPAEKITIKNLHLSTHNKRKFIINIGILAGIAHTYKASIGPFDRDHRLPQEMFGFMNNILIAKQQSNNAFTNRTKNSTLSLEIGHFPCIKLLISMC